MINDELLARFFSNQCTPEEAREVATYLQEHPDMLEKYLPEEEFLQIQDDGNFPETVSQQWLKNIHRQTVFANSRTKWAKRLAIAAVTAGVLIGGSLLLVNRGQEKETVVASATIASIPPEQQERKENTSGKTITTVLPDGSVVQLFPDASMVYNKQFRDNRNIYLTGEADFTVVADKQHPFVVYSSELYTTVLGTFFHVKAIPGEDMITVRLNTGKVLVQGAPNNKKVVLTPGKELRYYRKTGRSIVADFNTTGTGILVKAGNNNTGNAKPDWYKFNNQPMAQVLDQLSNYYGVAIYYYPSDVTEIYFDGKFEKTDSLVKILTDLTLPNNLKLIRNDSGFIIKKK
ncbi:FecR family protein [Chitinophaga ginsengisegetis]|uniref:FecR family protein n=1 Tax=Chitinophaga ginsengisegetis TaxID=393003 RepID=UPI000DB974FB|nr:FecR family protein [Chitinophaga ginsengisegetis]MDR6570694.1 ferric-dicitrate binding protein FerR (iron transport regulator) [Chitinophaga ginsengisegetis]MDR6650428.1 ferric-dicitrate binding protein FerR (iron transport regulator) [Chitinophaga ginsengisegetis]MDR6656933.1 ferric-dicitrate binding protein FerR (iron transport regulator) [Chitinophaga ginsengisegetis]